MVAMAIMAAVAGMTMPMMGRMYDAMQYRDGVRALVAAAKGARFEALSSGQNVDLVIKPESREIFIGENLQKQFAEDIDLEVTAARGLAGPGSAVIRFYPNGSSTGGDIRLEHESGRGLKIKVHWLFGRVSQHSLEEEFL